MILFLVYIDCSVCDCLQKRAEGWTTRVHSKRKVEQERTEVFLRKAVVTGLRKARYVAAGSRRGLECTP